MDMNPNRRWGPIGWLADLYRVGPVSLIIALALTTMLAGRIALEILPWFIRAVDRQ